MKLGDVQIVDKSDKGEYFTVEILAACDCPKCDENHWQWITGTVDRSEDEETAAAYGWKKA